VQVALDRADDHPAHGLVAARGQQRPDQLERTLHRARGQQQLGHEVLLALEAPPGLVHGRDHLAVHDLQRVGACLERLLGDRDSRLAVSVQDDVVEVR